MKLKDMGINSHPEGGMYEVSFGYHSDLYGYPDIDVGYDEVIRNSPRTPKERMEV
jgi:hypothetical protein